MLAASLVSPRDSDEMLHKQLRSLRYPVLATPKLDGIRCVTTPGAEVLSPIEFHHFIAYNQIPHNQAAIAQPTSMPLCRSLKRVPNDYIRHRISTCIPYIDGEIMTYSERDLLDNICRPRDFHAIQSDVMAHAGRPNFKFHVFDCNIDRDSSPLLLQYTERVKMLEQLELPSFCVKVLPTRCDSPEELQAFMAKCIADGHEGICFRDMLHSPYKYGRSTFRQGWLIKWKLFATSEAVVVAFEEEMQNNNVPVIGLLGQQERSSHQENMVGKNRLGAFVVELMIDREIKFKIGTGFTDQMREEFWLNRDAMVGKIVTFKHQAYGEKEAPRIPVFAGIRSPIDM